MHFATKITLLAIIAYCSGAVTPVPNIKDRVTALSKKCAAQVKLPPNQAKLAVNQDIPKTENEKCFLECVYEGVGVTHNGSFSLEGSSKLVNIRFQNPKEKEAATHLVNVCSKKVTKKAGEKCSLGRVVRECFVNEGKEVDFFPSA